MSECVRACVSECVRVFTFVSIAAAQQRSAHSSGTSSPRASLRTERALIGRPTYFFPLPCVSPSVLYSRRSRFVR